MRILFITSQITNSGGVSSILSKKANILQRDYSCEVAIASTNDDQSSMFYYLNPEIRLFFVETRMNGVLRLLQLKKEFQNIIEVFKPDIVSVADNGLKSFFFKSFIANNIPVVYEIHGNEQSFYNGDVSGVKALIHKRILKMYLPSFDAVVTQNSSFKLPKQIQIVKCIPNFVTSVEARKSVNYNKIVAVGRIVTTKNYDGLIKVWKNILQKKPAKELHIYGNWDDKLLVSKLQKQPNIFLHKPVKDIAEIYDSASLLLHTSFIESFPMVFLEAMSFGVPIVCFDINQSKIVLNNETGFVVKQGDYDNYLNCVFRLISDERLRKYFSDNSLNHVQNFSQERIIKKWYQLYQKLIN